MKAAKLSLIQIAVPEFAWSNYQSDALSITLPSFPNTSTNLIGWLHATEIFHRPQSYICKPTGFTFGFLTPNVGSANFTRNVGKKLPLPAV